MRKKATPQSTRIRSVSADAKQDTMTVTFKDNTVYRYERPDKSQGDPLDEVARAIAANRDPGKFFESVVNQHKRIYPYRKLR